MEQTVYKSLIDWYEIKDDNGNLIYKEAIVNDRREWHKYEYDSNGNKIYTESFYSKMGFNGEDMHCSLKHEYDSKGNEIYREYLSGNIKGQWEKFEHDSNGNVTRCEGSKGSWWKKEYDSKGRETYVENSNGSWAKKEWDPNHYFRMTYFENSEGDKYRITYDENGKELCKRLR